VNTGGVILLEGRNEKGATSKGATRRANDVVRDGKDTEKHGRTAVERAAETRSLAARPRRKRCKKIYETSCKNRKNGKKCEKRREETPPSLRRRTVEQCMQGVQRDLRNTLMVLELAAVQPTGLGAATRRDPGLPAISCRNFVALRSKLQISKATGLRLSPPVATGCLTAVME
jgi:hypothetical protein